MVYPERYNSFAYSRPLICFLKRTTFEEIISGQFGPVIILLQAWTAVQPLKANFEFWVELSSPSWSLKTKLPTFQTIEFRRLKHQCTGLLRHHHHCRRFRWIRVNHINKATVIFFLIHWYERIEVFFLNSDSLSLIQQFEPCEDFFINCHWLDTFTPLFLLSLIGLLVHNSNQQKVLRDVLQAWCLLPIRSNRTFMTPTSILFRLYAFFWLLRVSTNKLDLFTSSSLQLNFWPSKTILAS